MHEKICCYRCGASLADISLPLSRQDECPACENYLHVCRMCVHFDRHVPKQCREDDAEEVFDKERPNFCDWFEPAAGVFDSRSAQKARQAKASLAALFGDGTADDALPDDDQKRAEDLFK